MNCTTALVWTVNAAQREAFTNYFKLPLVGYRNATNAAVAAQGTYGYYWSTTPKGTNSTFLYIQPTVLHPRKDDYRSYGLSVRCFKNIQDTSAFLTTWRTTASNEQIMIPTFGTGYNFTIERGDGATGTYAGTAPNPTHTYAVAGDYQVSIKGDFPRFYMNNNLTHRNKLRSVDQWGAIAWTSMANAFNGCANVQILATDAPDLSKVTDMQAMFRSAINLTGNFNHWDTSNVTNMIGTFGNATGFNQPLNNWNTSKVTNMSQMFVQASSFNQPLNNWDTSKVIDMSYMFTDARVFNQNINNWNTSKVSSMAGMFGGAIAFNQPLNNWDTSKVTDMSGIFNYAAVFNQSLS